VGARVVCAKKKVPAILVIEFGNRAVANPLLQDRREIAIHKRKECAMNWDRLEGNWKQAAGKVKEKWGKLTDDDITVIAGKQEQLVGRIQERYGIAKDEAERQVKEWAGRL